MRQSSILQQQKILIAAARKFAEDGFLGARVDDIAASAGVNKRLLYHYVGAKAELFAAVLRQQADDLAQGTGDQAQIWALILEEAAHTHDSVLFDALVAVELRRSPARLRSRLAEAMFAALLPEVLLKRVEEPKLQAETRTERKPRLRMMPQVTAAEDESTRNCANRSK